VTRALAEQLAHLLAAVPRSERGLVSIERRHFGEIELISGVYS
jgi:hypothetical protein